MPPNARLLDTWCRPASGMDHGAICHGYVVSPVGWLDIRRGIPDAVCDVVRTPRRQNAHELRPRLQPGFEQWSLYAVMTLTDDSRRSLHNIEDLERCWEAITRGYPACCMLLQ